MTPALARGVIITGGGAGIGQATARRFAAQGDRVVILDRDGPAGVATAEDLGCNHFALQVDVSDEAALVEAIAAAHARLGRLDVLVNNAATIFTGGGPTLDLNLAAYRKLVAINVASVRVAAREAVAIMRAQGEGGAIVNLASLAGVVAVPTSTGYSASKAAVIGLTRSLARACLPLGIRVNAVLPGFTATETLRQAHRARGTDTSLTDRRIPLGRMAEPDEIAGVVLHLAAPDTSATHGALLAVDGGFHVYGGIGDAAAPGAVRPAPHTEPRVVLIAGADNGTGAAIAVRMQKAGAHVVRVDAGDRASAEAEVQIASGRFGGIDMLVNAGEAGTTESFDTAVIRALTFAQATVPAMIRSGGGAIINLCDAAEPAAQEMMAMLSRSLACEWAHHRIRVNAVVPGASDDTANGVAAAVDFLGSHDASYITGATYLADGGAAVI
jgi:NAD(P)-dependent dehydrogenase (short-subunit alcohol dehydrogenase family)